VIFFVIFAYISKSYKYYINILKFWFYFGNFFININNKMYRYNIEINIKIISFNFFQSKIRKDQKWINITFVELIFSNLITCRK